MLTQALLSRVTTRTLFYRSTLQVNRAIERVNFNGFELTLARFGLNDPSQKNSDLDGSEKLQT